MRIAIILIMLASGLSINHAYAQAGRVIPSTSERFRSANNGFNIDRLRVTLLRGNRARVSFTLSAAAAECANLSRQASPWLHLRFFDTEGHQYDIPGVMILSVPEARGYYPQQAFVSLAVIRDRLPSINRVAAWTGGYNCRR